MKPLNVVTLLMAVLLPASFLFADPGSNMRPYFIRSAKFLENVRKNYKAEAIANKLSEATAAKVCACQIMSVASNNEKMEYVAVFSEKTNYGELDNSFTVAMSVLENEKKQMKSLFFPKMKVLETYSVYSSCKTLAGQLTKINTDLKVYEMLDADILGSIYLKGKK